MNSEDPAEGRRQVWAAYVNALAGELGPQSIARVIKDLNGFGPSQPSVGRWLRGEHLPKPAEAAILARTFKASVLGAFVAAGYLDLREAAAGLADFDYELLRRAGVGLDEGLSAVTDELLYALAADDRGDVAGEQEQRHDP